MAELTDREKIIKDIYYNRVSGFGSIGDTLKQAKEKDVNITYKDVKEFLDKQKHRQTQFTYKRYNSFVSPKPLFEIELDLVDLTSKAEANKGYRYGIVGIDNFTKFAHVVPVRSRTAADVVAGTEEIIKKIGTPQQIYSDQEAAFNSPSFIRLMNKYKIKHITTVGKAHTVERFNRTLKEKITTRLDALGEDRDKWTSHLNEVVNKYNNTEHTTTKMTPNDARQRGNEMVVRYNIYDKAKTDRKYPPLEVGDRVRALLRKDNKTKGYDPKYTDNTYKVIHKRGNEFLIDDGKRKVYQRFELLKV